VSGRLIGRLLSLETGTMPLPLFAAGFWSIGWRQKLSLPETGHYKESPNSPPVGEGTSASSAEPFIPSRTQSGRTEEI